MTSLGSTSTPMLHLNDESTLLSDSESKPSCSAKPELFVSRPTVEKILITASFHAEQSPEVTK